MKLSIKPLSQRDARWRLKKIGDSNSTIGTYGCLLTCHSMAFSLAGVQQTPDILNETYKNNGVYNGDLIHFWSVPKVFPQIKANEYEDYYDTGAPIEKFYKWLDQGLPVIVLVDFDLNPVDGVDTHFVLLHGYDDETRELMCIDPWTGEEYFFKAKYGDPSRFIYGHRFYSWEVTNEPTCERKLAVKTQEAIKFSDMVDEKVILIGQLEKDLEKETIAKEDAVIQEAKVREKLAEVSSKQKMLEDQIETLETKIGVANNLIEFKDGKIRELEAELKLSIEKKIKSLSLWRLLRLYFKKGGD